MKSLFRAIRRKLLEEGKLVLIAIHHWLLRCLQMP